MTMHKKPRRTLAKLLDDYGDELIHDPRRTEAFLNDLCGKYTREIFVLVQAQRKRVPAELRAAPKWIPTGTTVNRLVNLLESQLALTPEAAAWAVESWAIALGLIVEDAPAPWYTRIPDVLRGRPGTDPQPVQTSPPTGETRTKSDGTASPAGTGSGLWRHLGVSTPRGGNPPGARQDAASVVQSRQATGDPAAGASPKRGTAKAVKRRNYLGFPAYLRKQAPNALLWSSILLISVILGWTVWDGTVLSGSWAWTNPPAASSVQPNLEDTGVSPGGSVPGPASQTGAERVPLLEHYAPPQNATVLANGLYVRAGPSVSESGLGLLQAGQSVTVVAYSPDARWAEVSGLTPGWVSTEYLAFTLSSGREVRLSPQSGRVQPQLERVALHSEPLHSAPHVGNLNGGEEIIAIAATLDDTWLHIVSPVSGWLMRGAVELFSTAQQTEPPTQSTQTRSPGT
jgi:hypothetical protein